MNLVEEMRKYSLISEGKWEDEHPYAVFRGISCPRGYEDKDEHNEALEQVKRLISLIDDSDFTLDNVLEAINSLQR